MSYVTHNKIQKYLWNKVFSEVVIKGEFLLILCKIWRISDKTLRNGGQPALFLIVFQLPNWSLFSEWINLQQNYYKKISYESNTNNLLYAYTKKQIHILHIVFLIPNTHVETIEKNQMIS